MFGSLAATTFPPCAPNVKVRIGTKSGARKTLKRRGKNDEWKRYRFGSGGGKELLERLSPYSYKLIRPELLQKILKKIDEPEEKVRYYWILKLIKEYGYDTKQIEINIPAGAGRGHAAVFADIVVYRDVERTEPFIVGETKAPTEKQIDEEQGASYARNIGAEYHFWSNKTTTKYWKTSKYPNKSSPVGNIPLWIGKKPIIEKVKKTELLPPFRNVQEFKQVISTLHNLIYKEGHDPAYAFDELTKLLFLKLYDERETPKYYEFMALSDESQQDTVQRIQELFDKAVKDPRYHDVFLTRYNRVIETKLDLKQQTIYQIVQQLQGYSLVNTIDTIRGVDIKGEAYEQMVGGTFRGELGQYFTPREIVDFMVKLLDPSKSDKILDPACGSGGFLIMCIKHVKDKIREENPNLNDAEIEAQIKYFCEHNIFGLDINPRMARVAKMNMIMHGDGHTGIFNVNGLILEDADPDDAKKNIRTDTFDLIFSNPPFAGYEQDPEILKDYELGKKAGKPRSVTKEVVFVERIIKLLKENGKTALVLPQGIYSDKALRYARDYIKKNCKILALIALPYWAFRPTGTGVRGSLMFLQKVSKVPADYDVFVDEVKSIGYDSKGRPDKSDLDDIYKDYLNPSKNKLVKFSDLDKCWGYTDTGRIDPNFFTRKSRAKLELFKSSRYPLKRLDEIAVFNRDRYNTKKEPDKSFQYIEINDVSVRSGKIRTRVRLGKDITQGTYIIHSGDLIISRRWPDRGAIAIVPKELEGNLIVSEFSILKINEELINKEYLYGLLKTRPVLDMIDIYSTGEMSHRISEEDLKRIEIAVPDMNTQEKMVKEMAKLKGEANKLIEQADTLKDEANQRLLKELGLPVVEQRRGQKETIHYDRMAE